MAKEEQKFSLDELETEFCKVTSTLTFKSNPFYASVLMQCARVYTFDIPTLAVGVTQQVLLLVNPHFFMGRAKYKNKETGEVKEVGCKNTEQRVAVIEHELLHLIFYHLSRGQRHSNREISNIAADAVCNQYVRYPLPGDPVLVDKLGFPKEKDLDWYYNELRKKKEDDKGQGQQANAGNCRGSHDSWDDQGEDGEDSEGNGNSLMKKIGEDGGGLSDSAREAIVCDVMRKAAEKEGEDAIGKLPGCVASQVKEMIKEKKATQPWNVILRRFVGSHGSSNLVQSIKYTSKRFRDPRTGRKARPGIRIKRSKKLLIGLDTSGSMSREEFDLFAGELRLIYRFNKDITVVQCDTEVHDVLKYRGELKYVVGRGGTDMQPIYEMYKQGDYDLCVLLTDGYIGQIGEKLRKPWLWVLTSDGAEPCDWGSYVRLPDPSIVENVR